jgi:hypothetical protein
MDEHLTFKNEGHLTLEQAATVGVGLLVSLLRRHRVMRLADN